MPEAGFNPSVALTALCVDDSEFDLKLNERVLRRSGAFKTILSVTSGADALDYLRNNTRPVDAIFLDVNMPRMTGFDFLNAAKAEFGLESLAHSVVIMLTSSLNPRDQAKANEFEAVCDFLSKPLTVEDASCVAVKIRKRLGA